MPLIDAHGDDLARKREPIGENHAAVDIRRLTLPATCQQVLALGMLARDEDLEPLAHAGLIETSADDRLLLHERSAALLFQRRRHGIAERMGRRALLPRVREDAGVVELDLAREREQLVEV